VEVALKELGVPFVRAKVGDRYVLEQLYKHGWQIGAEGSGHILCLDKHTTGDGIVSALQVLAAIRRADNKPLAKLLEGVRLFPQHMINVRTPVGYDWLADTRLAAERDAIEAKLGDSGRVLIRASGTEPVLRVMVEARDESQATSFAQQLANIVKSAT